MDKISTILIADNSEAFAQALAEFLRKDYEVYICHSGGVALRLLEELRPDDGLVIDLSLRHMAGLDVLNVSSHYSSVILVTTNIVTNYILAAAESAGITHLFLKPCKPGIVASRLQELLNPKEKAAP